MISREDIQNLAELARLTLTDEEVGSLQKDISNILEYVGQLSEGTSLQGDKGWSPDTVLSPVRNVMRDDTPRMQNDALAGKEAAVRAAFPTQEDGYNVVRKIIQKDE